jgi:catechol 2,3-dioxygenase-like lactoylglutathione lyase family enzyme
MNRGIDHLVLCVNDLDRARTAYAALGFTTTPPAAHPFGTGNSLVQLQGNFLELLAIIDESKISIPTAEQFSFGDFNRKFLSGREGMSMLVFEGHDAIGDQAEFAEKGLQTYDVFDFERQATLPEGETVTVGFSLAFVTEPTMPDVTFFTCQQHAPEYFWKPEFQRHENGAVAITEVIMVAKDPNRLEVIHHAMQGAGAVSSTGDVSRVETARGEVAILSPERFTARFDCPPPGPDGPHFAAYRISVRDLAKAETILARNTVKFRRAGSTLQIDPDATFGVLVEFAQAD